MEITFSKLESLAEAIGEGAHVRIFNNGMVALYTNRVVREDGDVNAVMPIATIYNKLFVTYDEALQLVKEAKPFILLGEGMKGEWAEGLYVISSKIEGTYYVLATYDPNSLLWDMISEESFKAIKKSYANKRHFTWISDNLIQPEPRPDFEL